MLNFECFLSAFWTYQWNIFVKMMDTRFWNNEKFKKNCRRVCPPNCSVASHPKKKLFHLRFWWKIHTLHSSIHVDWEKNEICILFFSFLLCIYLVYFVCEAQPKSPISRANRKKRKRIKRKMKLYMLVVVCIWLYSNL